MANKELLMDEFGLCEEEKRAIRSGTASQMRKYAISLEGGTKTKAQFTQERTVQFNPALIEIEPVVEIEIEVDQSAIEVPNQLFRAASCQIFVGRTKSSK